MEKSNRSRGKKVKKVRRKPPRSEIMPFSKLRREIELTSGELARFLKILRRILKEINDTVEDALDKSYGKEKELKYKKVEGEKGNGEIYEWECRQEK